MFSFTTRLLIAYDGTDFSGWQIQPNGISIQGLIEQALATLLRTQTRVIASGRTDAGVHAFGQVAHFRHEKPIDSERLLRSLNALLPPTIRIREVRPTHSHFHAQHHALRKIYHYSFQIGPTLCPFSSPYTLHVHAPLNLELMQKALPLFMGTHDFISFANEAYRGSAAKDAVRTLYRLDLIEGEEGKCRLEFEGNGFLYKMVRNITGTLLYIGRGKLQIEQIPGLFTARDRRSVPMAAPARGLALVHVFYPDE